jgi:hypothetical protein
MNDLARVIHELWMARRQRDGWRPGPYCPVRKTHDALVPFEQLSRRDRLALTSLIEAEELEEGMGQSIEYYRGPTRPILMEEIHEGFEVAFCDDCPANVDERTPRGKVISWESDTHDLSLITVRCA